MAARLRVAVLAAGELPERGIDRAQAIVAQVDAVIAADGGLAHADRLGCRVVTIVGDLDSASSASVVQAEEAGAGVLRFPQDKDETDLELALRTAEGLGASEIVVIGALGGRVDHELANIGLLASRSWFDKDIAISIDDGLRRIVPVHDVVEFLERPGTAISVLPWGGDADGVTERGMKWDLTDAHLPVGSPRGMSNVASEPSQRIQVRTGTLLAIVDRSEDGQGHEAERG